MKTTIIFIALMLLCFFSKAQLAKVSIVEPQKSTFKTLGNGLNLRAYEVDGFSFIPFHQMVESKDHYFKIGIEANYGYFKEKNLSIHVIQLNTALLIEKEFNIELAPDNNEGRIRPVKIFVAGNKIELIAINVDQSNDQFNICNWEFNLADFSVLVKNRNLASFPYSKKSRYEYLVDINKSNQNFGLCVTERKGKKSTDCAVHMLSCDNTMKTLMKQSSDFSLAYSEEILSKMQTSNSGETWALIAENNKKGETSNQVIHGSKGKISFTSLQQEGSEIINAAIALNKDNSGIYVAGLVKTPGENFSTMAFAEIDKSGKLSILDKADLKKEDGGLNSDSRVQQVVARDNGIVDVLTIEYSTKEVQSGNVAFPFDTKSAYKDMHVFSFVKNKLTNTKTLHRDITEKQTSSFFNNDLRAYSLPAAFCRNNDLYFLYLANASNADGSNTDIKKQTTSECLFVVGKMDENFKLKSQTLFDYSEGKDNFDMYAGMILCPTSEMRYFGYHETEFGLSTKAKLLFAVMELK